jgi:hypothetical protein
VSAARTGISTAAAGLWAKVKTADFPGWLVMAAGAALLGLGVLSAFALGPATTTSVENAQAQDGAVKSQVLAMCSGSDQLAHELQARGACDVAAKANQVPSAIDTGPTDAQVTRLIADYFVTHPAIYRPSLEAVTLAARAVLEANPELYRGPMGPQGVVTEAQVAAAIAAYVTANLDRFRGPAGENGAPGAPGRGIVTGPRFQRNNAGECESVVVYTDGAEDHAPAGDSSCPGGSGGSGGGSPEPPAPTAEQPSPTAEQPAPTTEAPPAAGDGPPAETAPPPTDGGLLGGLLGG